MEILNFNIFGGFQKNEYFGDMRLLWIFFFFLGGGGGGGGSVRFIIYDIEPRPYGHICDLDNPLLATPHIPSS